MPSPRANHVAIDVVEILHAGKKIVEIDGHLLPVEVGSLAEVIAEPLFPEADDVRSTRHTVVTPLRIAAGEIVASKFLRNVDFLPLRQRVSMLGTDCQNICKNKKYNKHMFHIGLLRCLGFRLNTST